MEQGGKEGIIIGRRDIYCSRYKNRACEEHFSTRKFPRTSPQGDSERLLHGGVQYVLRGAASDAAALGDKRGADAFFLLLHSRLILISYKVSS